MKNKISKKLLDLNFNASCKGFFLLVEAIEMKLENRMLNLGELCHLLAKKIKRHQQQLIKILELALISLITNTKIEML